jgi:intein/homing endonuclease
MDQSVKDIIAPKKIHVEFNTLNVDGKLFRTLFVSGYPRFVTPNWLSPLINFDHSLNVSMFIYPVESKSTLDDLRRKIAEMEAEISTDLQRGRVIDPGTQAKLEDALQLQQQLVKGEERFFQFSLYVTIFANDEVELEQITKQVSSTLGSLLITTFPALLQQADGFKATLPSGQDHLLISRNMDTTSLATTFPFTSSELTSNEGILYGLNEHNGSLVIFDRFSLENANTVVFAKAGAGKSIFGLDKALFDDGSGPTISQIGPLVNNLIAQQGAQKIDKGIEGVIDPKLRVWTFDENLKGQWSIVTVAARKDFSPRNHLYTITTKSGRSITITADHNLVIMRQGKIRIMRTEAIKIGESIPLPRKVNYQSTKIFSNSLLTLLGLITSEGLIYPNYVRIYNTDIQVLDIIKNSFKKIGVKHYSINSRGRQIGYSSVSEFAKQIIALGAGGKSGEKRVPPTVFLLSNEQASLYLKAYYEGDGGVDGHQICATTKSKDLASDLAYLLLRFGIVARIKPKQKSATNTINKIKNTYYQVSISGKDQLEIFSKQIGFLTETKNSKLKKLLDSLPVGNTNVDTIPTLAPMFRKLNNWLYPSSEIKTPQIIIDVKNGEYNPSRDQLLETIKLCESRISQINSLGNQIQLLRALPPITKLIAIGKRSRRLNALLWEQLGQSWRIMKQYIHPPLAQNALILYQTITGHQITVPQVSDALYTSFKEQGVSLSRYDSSLWSSIVNRSGNSKYSSLVKAAKFIAKQFRSTQLKIRHAKEKLSELKLLANSDLFWDPIVKIERVKHKEKYVYDLQVDNGVFLAGEGGLFVHNSYMVKLEILRSLMFGTEIIIIDPENEYKTLSDAVGGEYINFSFNSTCRINPFDLSSLTQDSDENELNMKILSLHSLFKVIMGQMSPSEEAILDRALVLTYKMKGITTDPETQKKNPPLMEDLYKALVGMEDAMSQSLADRIEKFVKGSFAGIIDQPSNVELNNPFTVFSVRDLEDAMKPIAIFIILDYIWTKMRRVVKKRLLIVDEAWYLMRSPDSASFLYGIAKRARKYFLGLTTITQDVEDFLSTDFGKAIVTNSSIQFLMKQSPAAIDKVASVFYLSEGEKHLLLSAEVGEGLFFAGNNHVAIKVVASPDEHKLVTTKPQEIFDRVQKEEKKAQELRLVSETE